jgi:glycosyltransferase involved in cell wall biosynthesis
MCNNPLVSIGMPVYNGDEYIALALDSITRQTFEDFEIIICDNASIDKTEEICRSYASHDKRIRYLKNKQNYGAAYNFNRVFKLSTGKYFKWAAIDDLLHPNYINKCIEFLELNPEYVCCHAKSLRIDAEGNPTGSYFIPMKYDSQSISIRFRDMVLKPHSCVLIFGLFRSCMLSKTPLIGPYFGSDRNLLAEISLLGKIHEIDKFLFYRRDHSNASVRKLTIRERIEWFDSRKKQKLVFPIWRNLYEYARSIYKIPFGLNDKIRCVSALLLWTKINWRWFGSDIVYAFKQFQ